MSVLDEIIDDLVAEHAALETVIEGMPPDAWDRPSPAPGWLARDQIAHLASTDDSALRAIEQPDSFLSRRRDGEPDFLELGRAMTPAELLRWWRSSSGALITAARQVEPERRLPWFGPPMSPASFFTARLMETWSHGLDVVDTSGITRVDTDRLRHIARLGTMTRSYSYRNQGRTEPAERVRVILSAPSGAEWLFGDEQAECQIRGSAVDFCRVVTRRRHVDDTLLELRGEAAREWMLIAQAFAGPPGEGRRPGQFPRPTA